MIINLDPAFNPIPSLQEVDFDSFTFKGGEPHIKITLDVDSVDEIIVSHRIKSFNDIGFVLVAIDALRRMDVKRISAIIPYFPATRQDRVMIPGEPLTVKVYADIFNGLKPLNGHHRW